MMSMSTMRILKISPLSLFFVYNLFLFFYFIQGKLNGLKKNSFISIPFQDIIYLKTLKNWIFLQKFFLLRSRKIKTKAKIKQNKNLMKL